MSDFSPCEPLPLKTYNTIESPTDEFAEFLDRCFKFFNNSAAKNQKSWRLQCWSWYILMWAPGHESTSSRKVIWNQLTMREDATIKLRHTQNSKSIRTSAFQAGSVRMCAHKYYWFWMYQMCPLLFCKDLRKQTQERSWQMQHSYKKSEVVATLSPSVPVKKHFTVFRRWSSKFNQFLDYFGYITQNGFLIRLKKLKTLSYILDKMTILLCFLWSI